MKSFRYILFVLCSLCVLTAYGQKKEKREVVSPEQEQQFSYYWYAAKQAIVEERYDEAYMLLEFCRMLKPNDGQTLQFLGIIYETTNQHDLAKATYKQAFEVAPRDQWRRYAEMLQQEAQSYAEPEAIRVMETAYEAWKTGKEKKKVVSDEYLLESLKKAYLASEQWKKTLAMQDELDRLKGPDDQSAYYRYRVYCFWGKWKKALEVVEKYLKEDPTDTRFWYFKALVQEKMNAKREAVSATYERLLELDAYNVEALNSYAYYLATHKGDLKKAESMSAITIRQQPNNAAYLDTYGWILHLQGQKEMGRFYLQKALQNCDDKEMRVEIIQHLNATK